MAKKEKKYVTASQVKRYRDITLKGRVEIAKELGLSEVHVKNIMRGISPYSASEAAAAVLTKADAYLKKPQ